MHACSLVFIVASLLSPAQGEVASGPEVGAKVEPLTVFAVTGDHAEKALDFVAERKDRPTVYVFVQADRFDRPMARFLRTLDTELARGIEGAGEARAVAVWLTDDAAKSKSYLPRAQQSLQFTQTDLAVFEGDHFGPTGWSIHGDAFLTAVVVRDGKVIARFGHVSVNETDVPPILKALKGSS